MESGELLFTSLGCATCHHERKGAQGPYLAGVFGTMQPLDSGEEVLADEDYVRNSILNPQGQVVEGYGKVMPSFKGMVTEVQISHLIAYVKSIGGTEEAESTDEEKPESPESASLNDAMDPVPTGQRYVRMER